MNVFKDVLNIMEKGSTSTKCNGEHNWSVLTILSTLTEVLHILTPLRNPRNRDNAGNSDCLHFPTTYTYRWEVYKKPWVDAQKILSLFVNAIQDPADNRETIQDEHSFTELLLGKGPE